LIDLHFESKINKRRQKYIIFGTVLRIGLNELLAAHKSTLKV